MLKQGTAIHMQASVTRAVTQMAACLQEGGVVVFPTETVYCIGARADRPAAVQRIRSLRPAGTLVPHLAATAAAAPLIGPLSHYQERCLGKLWPGPVSVMLEVPAQQIGRACEGLQIEQSLLYHAGAITLRCPDHAAVRQAISEAAGIIVGGTAVGTGGSAAARPEDLAPDLLEQVDLVVEDGPTKYGRPSTLVELDREQWRVVRSGALEPRVIERLLKTTVLFVCSGNTCRSPMAEAIAKTVVAHQPGASAQAPPPKGVEIISAGVSAVHGMPASEHAEAAVAELGGTLAGHRSQPLTASLVRRADLIFAMGRSHAAAVLALDPSADSRTLPLDPNGDIPDPIGADLETYRRVASQMKRLIERRLAEKKVI